MKTSRLHLAEGGSALLLTMAAVWLHSIAAASAGRLWRDEAAGVEVANLPTLADVWNNMQYDSFPVLWLLLARTVGRFAGPMNDSALRILGLTVGLGVVAILWFYARAFRHSFPLVSLALLALSPSVIIWGDSARAYGLAMLTILLTGALLWRFVERPSVGRWVAAAAGAIAAVHVVFFNSVLLVAFCAGAAAVCARRRNWRRAVLVLAVGGLAAISLLPYAGLLRDAGTWRMMAKVPEYSVAWFWFNLNEVLRLGGWWAPMIWIQLFAVTLWGGLRALRSRGDTRPSESGIDVVLFSIVTLTVGVVGQLLFLENLSYYPSPWYYLPLFALVAVCIDALSGALVRSARARAARLIGVLVFAGATIFPAMQAVRMPMTNVDAVVDRLQKVGTPRDLVLLNPWFMGVSFYRYYHGPSPWMAVPPIGVHPFHRYDLIKQKMMLADQTAAVRPALEAMRETLSNGGKVFVVGRLGRLPGTRAPDVLPAAPMPGDLWPEGAYRKQWSAMIAYYLQQHATGVTRLPLAERGRVTAYEDLHLIVASGWRP